MLFPVRPAMLCESRLWSMTYCGLEEEEEEEDPLPHDGRPPQSAISIQPTQIASSLMPAPPIRHSPLIHHTSTAEQTAGSQLPGVSHNNHWYSEGREVIGDSEGIRAPTESHILPSQPQEDLIGRDLQPGRLRRVSLEMEIPAGHQASCSSSGDVPCFLVPSSCQSICENYSDLHIGGDHVLPLSAANPNGGELLLRSESHHQPAGPFFLHSCDVPLAVEDSPPPGGQISLQGGGPLLCPLRRRGSNRRSGGGGRDRSFLFQGCSEGPFSNSLLNRYLEHKLLDLYRQYMLENMAAREAGGSSGGGSGPACCPLLGSELVLTSLDQITLQLSREGNLEAGMAKDMVLSCLLRVASDYTQSTEISTPILQISDYTSRDLQQHTSVHTDGPGPQSPGALNSSDLPVKDVV